MNVRELIEHLTESFDPDEVLYLVNGVGVGTPLGKENVYREEDFIRVPTKDGLKFIKNSVIVDAGW